MDQREVFLRQSLDHRFGEALVPSALAAAASPSNQRVGVAAATVGSVTTPSSTS
jgi:hypothetical protein